MVLFHLNTLRSQTRFFMFEHEHDLTNVGRVKGYWGDRLCVLIGHMMCQSRGIRK